MRIFRKQSSFLHSLFRRSLSLRSWTLLSVFLISMISLLGALTRPLAGTSREGLTGDHTPIRGNVLSIPSLDGPGNRTNDTRFEPRSGPRRVHARAAGVVYITKKELGNIYIEDDPRSVLASKGQAPVAESGGARNLTGSSGGDRKGQSPRSNNTIPIAEFNENSKRDQSISKSSDGQTIISSQRAKSANKSASIPKEKAPTKTQTSSKDPKSSPGRTGELENLHQSIPRTIQYYAQPPWLNNRDIHIMRLLTEGVMQRRIGLSQNRSTEYLLYLGNVTEVGDRLENNSVSVRIRMCADAVSLSCKEWQRALAYHLDRIIGLNRVVPTAGRYVTELYSTTVKEGVSEVAIWFPADLPAVHYGDDSLEATRYVKKKFWRFSDRQKWSLTDDCAKNVEDERARMAVFMFLLQIKEKQLQECFKYPANHSHAPKHQEPGSKLSCRNTFWGSGMRLAGQTWCLPPLGVDVNDTDSFNYTMLETIERFPSDTLGLIRSSKLRQHLLQSLFVDRIFWEGRGSRRGVEKILQVMDRRSKALAKWFKTKGFIQR